MRRIIKSFPGVVANDNLDFQLLPGEVHALLGENGAGKTTLMNILYGLYRPDSGQIIVKGREAKINSPRDAMQLGIGMVHQHLKLVSTHSVAENIILGLNEPRFFLKMDEVHDRIHELGERYGLPVNPQQKIWQLSMGERQRVEILKILFRESDILVLDEPTALLAPPEIGELFAALRRMASEGRGVVFISHKLNEVLEVSDRITVLRRGRAVDTRRPSETNTAELANLMVGRPVLFKLEKKPFSPGAGFLELQNVEVMGDKGLPALKGISLEIRAGEILGLAGVAGNGQRELAEVITGLRRLTKGKIYVNGLDFTSSSPLDFLSAGISYVPEDRQGVGSVASMTVAENLVLREYRNGPFARNIWLDFKAIDEHASQLVSEFSIMTPDTRNPVQNLSGGNLQKLILARELSRKPKLIVAEHPTRGLDVGATEYVHQRLIQAREQGSAVLLISEDLDEILTLGDNVAVIYEGKLVGLLSAQQASIEVVGMMMAGSSGG